MKSGLTPLRAPAKEGARSDLAECGIPGTASGTARPVATAPQDSELAHSFGPGEIGFDFLPLEVPTGPDLPLPTGPATPLPSFDLAGDEPLPELLDAPAETTPLPAKLDAPPPARASARPQVRARSAGEIWLEGSSILCSCPDCRAPMTIRIWLMVADCWRCGTCIELSQEQEREVQRLLAQQEAKQSRPAASPAPPPRFKGSPTEARQREGEKERVRDRQTERQRDIVPSSPPLSPAPPPAARQEPRPPAPQGTPQRAFPTVPGPTATPPPQHSVAARAAAAQQLIRREPWIRHLVNDTPAWLISMLVHLI